MGISANDMRGSRLLHPDDDLDSCILLNTSISQKLSRLELNVADNRAIGLEKQRRHIDLADLEMPIMTMFSPLRSAAVVAGICLIAMTGCVANLAPSFPAEIEYSATADGGIHATWFLKLVSGSASSIETEHNNGVEYPAMDEVSVFGKETKAVIVELGVTTRGEGKYTLARDVQVGETRTIEILHSWSGAARKHFEAYAPIVENQDISISLQVFQEESRADIQPLLSTGALRYIIR